MIVMLMTAMVLQASAPVYTELRVERIRFSEVETREYRVEGGLGLRCTLVSTLQLKCDLAEFYAEFDRSHLHQAISITATSICVTKQARVPWMMYETWLGTVMQRHLFPNRKIRFMEKGVAKHIPMYHRDTLNQLESQRRKEEEE